jgi:hypothetical protein
MILIRVWVVTLWIIRIVSANPISLSSGDKPGKGPYIPVPQLYPRLPITEIPTTIENDIVLTNNTKTRYGYFVGRPVARFFRGSAGQYFLKLLSDILSRASPLLHWAILISNERPKTVNGELAKSGTKVPHPDTGIIFELRNSRQTHLIYLDVKNWANYVYQQDKLTFLGALNYTDEEILNIGRAYVREIGREGFHNFYRNCQHFTSWYIKALWPKSPPTATRVDQLLGKLLWWFRDWRKTGRWGANKMRGWFGLKTANIKELDSSTEFVGIEDMVSRNSRSGFGN